MADSMTRRPLIAAGTLLGIGMGGFVDGILFHQLLQVQSMLSARVTRSTVAGLEVNMFWDGLFHVLSWTVTALGLALLWKAVQRPDVPLSTKTFVGAMAIGWGLFNLVEGIIDHHLMHIRHRNGRPPNLGSGISGFRRSFHRHRRDLNRRWPQPCCRTSDLSRLEVRRRIWTWPSRTSPKREPCSPTPRSRRLSPAWSPNAMSTPATTSSQPVAMPSRCWSSCARTVRESLSISLKRRLR
jgi:uncharacterized membrane protein